MSFDVSFKPLHFACLFLLASHTKEMTIYGLQLHVGG